MSYEPPTSSQFAEDWRSVLFLDVGNHRLKWRLDDTGGSISHNGNLLDMADRLAESFGSNRRQIDRVRVNLSRSHRFFAELERSVNRRFSLPLTETLPHKRLTRPVRLCLAYDEHESLGVDRWCAMVAARGLFPNETLVIVDAGSALTVDLVNADGAHLGGYISCGLASAVELCRSMCGLKSEVFGEFNPTDLNQPGQNSRQCIERGVVLQICAFIERICENAPGIFGSTNVAVPPEAGALRAIFTGGDAIYLDCSIRSCPSEHIPDLVLDGLRLVDPL